LPDLAPADMVRPEGVLLGSLRFQPPSLLVDEDQLPTSQLVVAGCSVKGAAGVRESLASPRGRVGSGRMAGVEMSGWPLASVNKPNHQAISATKVFTYSESVTLLKV
jgi:hypothetical protein